MTKERQIEFLGERLLAVQGELDERDLTELPTHRLFDMMIRLLKLLGSENVQLEFLSEEEMSTRKSERMLEKFKIKK